MALARYRIPSGEYRSAKAEGARRITPEARIIDAGTQVLIEAEVFVRWRQRVDLLRALQKVDAQVQAVCRRVARGDLRSGKALWLAIQGGVECEHITPGLIAELAPYLEAMEPLAKRKVEQERRLTELMCSHPLWTDWGRWTRGIGPVMLGGVIAECGQHRLIDYKSVSAVWKRFGLAVINGERQRLRKGEGVLQGFSPERRGFVRVIQTSLMRAQRRADGDRPADPYRAIYDQRREYELARGIEPQHATARAGRVMGKALLRDVWLAAQRIDEVTA